MFLSSAIGRCPRHPLTVLLVALTLVCSSIAPPGGVAGSCVIVAYTGQRGVHSDYATERILDVSECL